MKLSGPCGASGHGSVLSPIPCRQDSSLHDLLSSIKQLLIKEAAAKKLIEARLKGPEKLIKIRDLETNLVSNTVFELLL